MLCSVRCWKLSRVSIICLTKVAEAQSFGLLIVSILRHTVSPPSLPKSMGIEGHAAIHGHAQLWMCRSRWIGLTSVKGFLMEKESTKRGYFTQGYNMEEPFVGMHSTSPCFFVSNQSQKVHSRIIHHCSVFLLLIDCRIWLPCSGSFLNT